MPEFIIKRNGNKQRWNVQKIYDALERAFIATYGDKEDNKSEITSIVQSINLEINNLNIIQQEELQNIIEKVLMDSGNYDVGKKYILYRQERTKEREKKTKQKKKVKLSNNAYKVAKSRYLMEDEDWNGCALRAAEVNVTAETDFKKRKKYQDLFEEMIVNMEFLAAGRILRNSGRPKGSLLNCFVTPIEDSREGIGQALKDCFILWGEGGGTGINFSPLRPKGAEIKGVGGVSSGLISFMEVFDKLAEKIESGGGRRAAALGGVHVEHPEILDFIDAKMEQGILPHFNISVIINNEFLEAVESNAEWNLTFNNKIYNTVPARDIWNKIINNMIKHAEPGLLNWSNAGKNNSYYYAPPIICNPCAEAVLESYGSCDLGSLVLPKFINNGKTNWKRLEEVIKLGVRFLDNVLDVNNYALAANEIAAQNSRRIGLGVMGLAEYLFAKEIRYGSEKAILEVEKLMKFIRDNVYQTLIELSVEKGAFPKFDSVQYGKASFIKKLPAAIRSDIKEYGSRCVTGMAIAPTGTISLLPEVTPSIEPLPFKAYRRVDRVGERVYIHPLYKQYIKDKSVIPDWFVDSYDLKPEDHFEMQAVVQKHTDGAVSKTINMPKGTTSEQLNKLLLEYIHDLKGVTVYVDGSREGQIYQKMNDKEVMEYLAKEGEIVDLQEEDVQCKDGKCEI